MMTKLLLFFQQFSIWFEILLRELLNNLISLIFIFAVYLILWHFPQAIDLLLILNQAEAFFFEVPFYFSLLTISAFLIWNAPKYFYYHNYKDISFSNIIGFIPNQHYKFQNKKETTNYPYLVRTHMRKTIPRILAILLLVISALSILNAMELFELNNTYTDFLDPGSLLILIIFILLLLSEPKYYEVLCNTFNRLPKTNFLVISLSIGSIALMISLGTLNTQAEKDLGNLFLSNSALVLFFFTLSFNSYHFLKEFPQKLFYGSIILVGFIILLFFLFLNFIPGWAKGINPLSIIMLSLLSLFMISFILILTGKKLKLPLFSIIFLFSFFSTIFFSKNSDHFHLILKPTEIHRLPMDQYVYQWIKSRESLIENENDFFPVILVSAEGGGSRAGLWSFLVHSYLYEKSNGTYFQENLLSLTGASGGSVGNAMFFAGAQRAYLNNTKADFRISPEFDELEIKYKASAIYKENYLSVALMSLLGRDLFKNITGLFNFKNRGQLLEEQWSNAHEKYFHEKNEKGLLENDFLSFYKDVSMNPYTESTKVPPLLFINTTHTQTGNYNIISPVRYSHLRPLIGMDDFLDNLQSSYPDKSIALSTAMRINASFPFVTPVGEIRKKIKDKFYADQYADAGYYDNIGGRVSKGVEDVFRKIMIDSFPSLVAKVRIEHLLIANDEEDKITKTQTQMAAPLTTLKNVRFGHTQEIMKRLGDEYAVKLKQTAITPLPPNVSSTSFNGGKLLIKPVLPLGRYLSAIAIRSMEARLEEVSVQLDSIL